MFDPTKIPGSFRFARFHALIAAVATPIQILPYNPYRIAFLLFTGSNAIMLTPFNIEVTFSPVPTGMMISANGGNIAITFSSHGPLVQQNWWACLPTGGTNGDVYVWETLWVPPGE